MLSTSEPNSKTVHRLARFVTEETAAQMFNLKPEQIYLVECWQNVVYVHGEGVSRFVSYADFPPIVGVEPPSEKDFFYWRRRWKKKQPPERRKKAPEFWAQFFAHNFQQALGMLELYNWGELLNQVKSVFTETTWDKLQEVYSKEELALETFDGGGKVRTCYAGGKGERGNPILQSFNYPVTSQQSLVTNHPSKITAPQSESKHFPVDS